MSWLISGIICVIMAGYFLVQSYKHNDFDAFILGCFMLFVTILLLMARG